MPVGVLVYHDGLALLPGFLCGRIYIQKRLIIKHHLAFQIGIQQADLQAVTASDLLITFFGTSHLFFLNRNSKENRSIETLEL